MSPKGININLEDAPTKERSPVDDQFGLTQESMEALRAEYLSIGGLVKTLPDPSEVRDFTISTIMSSDKEGSDVANLWMMINGKWFHLGYSRTTPNEEHIIDADGTLADITTKFNSLLGKLETLGLLSDT
jgi:hypothetical protein